MESMVPKYDRNVALGRRVVFLKSLSAHAHHDAVGPAVLPTAEDVKVVEVRGLIFKQQRPVSMAGGERAGSGDERG